LKYSRKIKASSDKPAEVSFSEDSRVMRAAGILVNSIASVSPYWDPHLSTQQFFQELAPAAAKWGELIEEQAIPLLKRYGSKSYGQKAFEKTLTADRLLILNVGYKVSRLAHNESVLDVISRGIPDEFEPDQSSDRREYLWSKHIALWYEGTLQHRTVAVLKEGYMALVPRLARVDDIVCILFGCDTPVVLRPNGDGFEFIGECFIHGIMDGELIKEYEEGSIQLTEFVIR
jgi:hypothetical protein